MGYKHSREDLLAAARDVALESGIATLTFSAVGARAGVSDRTVVYYFPTKTELIQEVTGAIGAELQDLLADAFGSQPLPPTELLSRAWPTLTSARADRIFALMFEIIGLAGAGRAPFVDIAAGVMDAWVDWLAGRSTGSTPAAQRRNALVALAQIDGLLLLRLVAGPAAADEAAGGLGILPDVTRSSGV